jgi:hypothetical protein
VHLVLLSLLPPTLLHVLCVFSLPAEVLAVYEDEVVLLQEQLLQQGAERGLPGLKYQLAELQVRQSRQKQHNCSHRVCTAVAHCEGDYVARG